MAGRAVAYGISAVIFGGEITPANCTEILNQDKRMGFWLITEPPKLIPFEQLSPLEQQRWEPMIKNMQDKIERLNRAKSMSPPTQPGRTGNSSSQVQGRLKDRTKARPTPPVAPGTEF